MAKFIALSAKLLAPQKSCLAPKIPKTSQHDRKQQSKITINLN